MNLIKLIRQFMEDPIIVDAEVQEVVPVTEVAAAPETVEEALAGSDTKPEEVEEVVSVDGQCEVCVGKGRVSDKESCSRCEGTGVQK